MTSKTYEEKIADSSKAQEELESIKFDHVPYFAKYVRPQDVDKAVAREMIVDEEQVARFLCPDPACHGCFYYGMTGRKAYEDVVLGFDVQYDLGQLSNQARFRTQLESIAYMYGVNPEAMTKHWNCVSLQFEALGFPMLPDEEQYRFNRTPEIRLQ